MWSLEKLFKYSSETLAEINGKWVPARPMNWQYRPFKQKLKEALAVFNGTAEAFTWPEGQQKGK